MPQRLDPFEDLFVDRQAELEEYWQWAKWQWAMGITHPIASRQSRIVRAATVGKTPILVKRFNRLYHG